MEGIHLWWVVLFWTLSSICAAMTHAKCHADSQDGEVTSIRIALFQPIGFVSTPETCTGLYKYSDGVCYYDYPFKAISAAGLLAVKHFNERNSAYVTEFGNLSSCPLRLEAQVFNIPSNSPKQATQTMLNVLDAFSPHVIVGTSSSSTSKPTSLISGVFDIPQISYWATSKSLDDTINYPRFLRTIPTDDAVAFSICNFWSSLGYTYAAMLYINDAYGEAFKESTVDHCIKSGMENVFSFPFSEFESDYQTRSQVAKLANTGIHVFLLVDYTRKFTVIMEAAYEYGILGKEYSWVFGESVYTNDIAALSPELRTAVDGSLRVFAPGGVNVNPRWKKFIGNWNSFNASYLNSFWPLPFQVGDDFYKDPPNNIEELMELRVPGAFQYDAVAAAGIGACKLAASGEDLLHQFGTNFWELKQDLEFNGLSGKVRFDSIGNRDISTANYEMSNILASADSTELEFKLVATFDTSLNIWQYEPSTELRFNGGSTLAPDNYDIPLENRKWDYGVKVFCRILFGFNFATSIFFLSWTIFYRKHPIVMLSQALFLELVAFGAIVSSLTIIPLTIDDEFYPNDNRDTEKVILAATIACNSAVWLYCVGFVLTFAPLFSKMWRVKKVFNKSLRKVQVTNRELLKFIFGFMAVECAVLLIWSAAFPLQYVRKVISQDEFGSSLISSGGCVGDNSTYFISILGVLHFSMLIYGNVLCYQCRSINNTIAETKWIGIAMVSNFQVLAIGVPVLLLLADEPISNMFVRSAMIFLNDFTIQCLIFVPKILSVNFGIQDHNGEGGELTKTRSSNAEGLQVAKTISGSSLPLAYQRVSPVTMA